MLPTKNIIYSLSSAYEKKLLPENARRMESNRQFCKGQQISIMKKAFFERVVAVMTTIFLSLFLFTGFSPASKADGNQVIIRAKPSPVPGRPRIPAYCPFSGYIMDNYLLLMSECDCGIVEVELTSPSGDSITMDFVTTDAIVMIPINGETGAYTITIQVPGGIEFEGSFLF